MYCIPNIAGETINTLMSHKKLTKLTMSVSTVKKHTPPIGGEVTISLPHDIACDWANKILPVLNQMKNRIEQETTQVTISQPEQTTNNT